MKLISIVDNINAGNITVLPKGFYIHQSAEPKQQYSMKSALTIKILQPRKYISSNWNV